MRKKILLGGGALLIILVSAGVIVSRQKSPERKTCEQFIKLSATGNATAAYALFSPAARAMTSADEWQADSASLPQAFGASYKLTLVSSAAPAAPASTRQATAPTRLFYTLQGRSDSFNIRCYVVHTANGYLVDVFDSKPAAVGSTGP